MKILQINSVCGLGSTGKITIDLQNVLEQNGHSCLIAYGRGHAQNSPNAVKVGNTLSVALHVIKTRLLDRHGLGSKAATKQLIKIIKQYSPDVIHLHNIHGYYVNFEILFKFLSSENIPIVWTLHDCWAFTGHCAYFDYANCYDWKSLCSKCKQLRKYPKSLFLDNSKKMFIEKEAHFTLPEKMIIVTPSNWLKEKVKESFLRKYQIDVINNGIDLKVFRQTESYFRNYKELVGKTIILGVSNIWDERKGLNCFIKLSQILDEDYKIVLVGLSDKQLKTIPKNIIGIKRTNNSSELAGIYSGADIFLNPTLEDNYPTTNLEAIACGTYVISYDTGGCSETIRNCSGETVKKGDFEGLIKAIKRFEVIPNSKTIDLWYLDKNERYLEYIEIYNKLCKDKEA